MSFPQYTETQPTAKPAPFQPTTPALRTLVDRAIAAYPGEEARIRRGAEIVEKDGVRVQNNGMYVVGIHHYYYLVNGECVCPDIAHRPDNNGRCKHKWAKTFYIKLHATQETVMPTPRTKTFVACLVDTVGIVTIYEDNRASFVPYDTALEPWWLSDYEIAYTMVLGKELGA